MFTLSSKNLIHLFVLAIAVLSAGLAHAQESTPVTRYDIFGGYSYLRLDTKSYGFLSDSNLNGAELSPAINITHNFSAVADFSAYFGQNQKFYGIMVGPQYAIDKFHGRFFGQALFGKARNKYEITDFASSLGRSIALGVGYDLPFRDRFALRLFQVEYWTTKTYSVNQSNIRVSAGIQVHLGKKLK